MTLVDRTLERIARMLPDRTARWLLGTYFQRRFRRHAPCMVDRVVFLNYATFLGLSSDALDTEWGPRWATVTYFGGDAYWLETAETRSHILASLERLLEAGAPLASVLIDRSRLRGLGYPDPSHPSYHASFSLWRKMGDTEVKQMSRATSIEASVQISGTAYLFKKELL